VTVSAVDVVFITVGDELNRQAAASAGRQRGRPTELGSQLSLRDGRRGRRRRLPGESELAVDGQRDARQRRSEPHVSAVRDVAAAATRRRRHTAELRGLGRCNCEHGRQRYGYFTHSAPG